MKMYKKQTNRQLTIYDFDQPLGLTMNQENRWVKKADSIPWSVIEELIEIAKEMRKAAERGEDLGLSQDEVAFYDALADHVTAKEVLGDEKLRAIAHELTKVIKENMTIDWNRKESARAKMRITVRKLLRKYGYPPDLAKMAVETVVKQAELMAGNK